jgi:hypothetical protein
MEYGREGGRSISISSPGENKNATCANMYIVANPKEYEEYEELCSQIHQCIKHAKKYV